MFTPLFCFQNLSPLLFLLLSCLLPSFLKKFPPPESVICFSPSPEFLPPPPLVLVPPLVFISRGGEGHLTPALAQGKVGDGSCWQGMVSCFLHHGGMDL